MARRRRAGSFVACTVLATLAACGVPPAPEETGEPTLKARPNGVHVMLRDTHLPQQAQPAGLAPAGAHLNYYGGPVISNLKLFTIFWNGSVNYQSQLNQFFGAITNSSYVSWLSEYNAGGQTIGLGSFAGSYVDTGAPGGNLNDSQIQSEISRLIAAQLIPPNDGNTMYMVYFPPGVGITDPSGYRSCIDFCAYHGTYPRNNGYVFYGIIPDQGGGCLGGCGTNSSTFNNTTSVSSHEMVETITDPAVGVATSFAPPLAWYDPTYYEIGDICNGLEGSVVGSDGNSWVIQLEFSNQANDCIAQKVVANDFTVAINPASQTVNSGANAVTTTYTINTATASGNAQSINLTVSGLTAGITGAFNPASVTSGQSSTLTLTVPANAASSTSSLTVTAAGASATHTVAGALTVKGADFSVSLAPASATVTAGANPVTQAYTVATAVTQGAAQSIALTLSGLGGGVTGAFNPASITAGGSSTLTLTVPANAVSSTSSFTVTAAGTVATHAASASLTVNGTGPKQLIVNGGFETGNFSGWTTGGSTAIANTAHTGAHSAQVGSTGAFNGDSTLSQTFAVPATGKTNLSFWWQGSCADTVQYDWQLVQLFQGNTVLKTLVAKQCSSNGWTQVTSDLSAYAGKTVILKFLDHDDGYSNPPDPTYILVDDVSVTNQ